MTKRLFWLIAILALAALACNAPTTGSTPPPEAPLEAEGEPPTDEPAAPTEDAPDPSPTPEPQPTEADPDPTATSDSGAGGLTRTDGPTNDDIFRAFRDDLVEAIVAREYDTMQALMGDEFVIGFYQSEGLEFDSSEEAIAAVEEDVITQTASVRYTLGADVTDSIEPDPMSMWAPDVNVVAAIPFEGFGSDGESDALVIIAQNDEDGSYYWYAVLLVPGGLAE